jgi:hypothetical protein
LIDVTLAASHDPTSPYHEIAVEARMSEPPKKDDDIIDIGDLDGEDLACLGLRRAFKDDFFRIWISRRRSKLGSGTPRYPTGLSRPSRASRASRGSPT